MTADLQAGFADPARDSARAFRAILGAMARPGTQRRVMGVDAPSPLSPAAAAILLTLADTDTPLWLGPSLRNAQVKRWIVFHTGAHLIEEPTAASFALGLWPELPIPDFPVGTPEYPDRSATVIVEVDGVSSATEGVWLTGPGIAQQTLLSVTGANPRNALRYNAARFPLGLDFLFTAGQWLTALPRSTRIGG